MLGVSGNGGGGGRGECDSDGGGGDGGSDGGGGACRVERSGAAVRARIIFVAGPRQRVVIHDRLLAANQRRGRLSRSGSHGRQYFAKACFSTSSTIPSPFGSMRRISASCAGVRVDASRWIEAAALMLPVWQGGREGRELPG